MSKLTELKKRHADLAKQMQQETQALFKEASDELFEAFPEINEFSWTQYTPYFMDGDECVFSVNSDYPKINGVDEYGDRDDEAETAVAVSKKAYKAVSSLLRQIDDGIMKSIFGDHVKVTIKRGANKAVVEEYDHE